MPPHLKPTQCDRLTRADQKGAFFPSYFTFFALAKSDLQSLQWLRYLALTSEKEMMNVEMLPGCEVLTRKKATKKKQLYYISA